MSLGFVREFLRSPGSVGAIWPSSPALAREMVRASGVSQAKNVLELGPGSGAFTGEILRALAPGARFLAIEKSPDLAKTAAKRFPDARVIEGCATRISHHLSGEKFDRPDAILCGLPWAAFSQELQSAILSEIVASLAEGGTFCTFAYFGPHVLPAGCRFRKSLRQAFREVGRTRVVLANIPPAFVYRCKT